MGTFHNYPKSVQLLNNFGVPCRFPFCLLRFHDQRGLECPKHVLGLCFFLLFFFLVILADGIADLGPQRGPTLNYADSPEEWHSSVLSSIAGVNQLLWQMTINKYFRLCGLSGLRVSNCSTLAL